MGMRSLDGSFVVMGTRVPRVVVLLVGLTLGLSILGAVGSRNGFPLLGVGALVPVLVLGGQVWRLVTWVFFETDALPLVFGLLGLWWFGGDLSQTWGPRRFLGTYLGFAAATGLTTSLLALVIPGLVQPFYIGPWPIVDALIIAWATHFPYRDLYVYFVLPLRGRNLIYATLAGTLLLGLLYGLAGVLPHFIAEGFMLAYLRGLGSLWLRIWPRKVWTPRRSSSRLRSVEKSAREEPPRWLH